MTEHTKIQVWFNHMGEINVHIMPSHAMSVEDASKRLTDCWNALAGISDPEAFMRKVRELMIAETSIPINRQIDVICEHLKGGAA